MDGQARFIPPRPTQAECVEKLEKQNAAYNEYNRIHQTQELDRPTNPKADQERIPAEFRVVDPVTGGAKGQKLCEMGALDPKALIEVGKVAGYGGKKYERYNFAKGYKWSLSYDALQRHLMAFWDREDIDDESDLYHLAHAGWHCLALLTFVLRGKGTDDRFPT